MANFLARHKHWLRLALGTGLLAALLSQIDLRAATGVFARVHPGYALLALGAATSAAIPAAWAWKLLLDSQGLRLPFTRVLFLYAVGVFFGTFTPGGLGSDAVRVFQLERWTGRGLQAGVSIAASRLLSLLSLSLILIGVSLVRPGMGALQLAAGTLAVLLGAALSVTIAERALRKLADVDVWPRVSPLFSGAAEALLTFRKQPGVGAQAAGLLGVFHVLAVLPIYLFAMGLGFSVPLLNVIALGLGLRLLLVLPISFSGLGIYEVGFVVLFNQVGLDAAQALALVVLERLFGLVIPTVGAAAYLRGWGKRVEQQSA